MGFMTPDAPTIPKPEPKPEPKKEKRPRAGEEELADPNRTKAMKRARARASSAAERGGASKFRQDLSQPIGTQTTRGGVKIFKPRKRASLKIDK